MKKVVLNPEQFREADSNSKINTNILSCCIGVILYNPLEKAAYACHLANPQGNFNRFLQNSKDILGESKNLFAYCAGASTEENTNNKYFQYTLDNRNFVLSELEKFGILKSNIKYKWASKPQFHSVLELEISSGKTNVTIKEGAKKVFNGGLN